MKKLILVTGGQRSGKSEYAERMELSLSENPVYMATAHVWDEEFRQRVVRHQERRGPQWTNIEEECLLSRHQLTGRVVLIDCSEEELLRRASASSDRPLLVGDKAAKLAALLAARRTHYDSFPTRVAL